MGCDPGIVGSLGRRTQSSASTSQASRPGTRNLQSTGAAWLQVRVRVHMGVRTGCTGAAVPATSQPCIPCSLTVFQVSALSFFLHQSNHSLNRNPFFCTLLLSPFQKWALFDSKIVRIRTGALYTLPGQTQWLTKLNLSGSLDLKSGHPGAFHFRIFIIAHGLQNYSLHLGLGGN